MRLVSFAFCSIYFIFAVANGSVLDPNVKHKNSSDEVDSRKALYLTEYIERGDIQIAKELALVKLPNISIESYSGYFTVNKTFNSNMFFWFFPAKNNPENAPVMLWLAGGPGGSDVVDLLRSHGPITVTPELKVVPREQSWYLNHNMIYIDNPVGTGYSFTDELGYSKNATEIGQNLLVALRQFFLLFPEYQKNEFFVSGESYGGKQVPSIGYAIHQDSKRQSNDPKKPTINLKGMFIINGWTDPINQINYADYLYQLGLIDTNGHAAFVELQNQCIDCLKKRDLDCASYLFGKLLVSEFGYKYDSLYKNLTGFESYHSALNLRPANTSYMGKLLDKSDFRRAIHVGDNIFNRSKKVLDVLRLDFMRSLANWVAELLSHYRILISSSQLDMIVAYPNVENYLKNLNFSGANEFKAAKRHIWRVDNEIAGYFKQAANLTEVLIRNASHAVLAEHPKLMLNYWRDLLITRGSIKKHDFI